MKTKSTRWRSIYGCKPLLYFAILVLRFSQVNLIEIAVGVFVFLAGARVGSLSGRTPQSQSVGQFHGESRHPGSAGWSQSKSKKSHI